MILKTRFQEGAFVSQEEIPAQPKFNANIYYRSIESRMGSGLELSITPPLSGRLGAPSPYQARASW